MTVMTIDLKPEFAAFLEKEVEDGRYESLDAAIEEAVLQLLPEDESPEYTAWLLAELQKGLDDVAAGRLVEWNPDEIMQEVERRFQAK